MEVPTLRLEAGETVARSTMPPFLLLGLLLLPVALPASAPPSATGAQEKVCPWCKNDPVLLKAAGLVSHGPFLFGVATSDKVAERLGDVRVYFLESAHLRIASMLGEYTVPDKEAKKIRAELKELKAAIPRIDDRTRRLDPWLRLHIAALRAEKQYAAFLDLLGKKESDFPDGQTTYDPGSGKPYMGEGPYLGEKDKYDLYLAETLATYQDLLVQHYGVTTKKPQRWNSINRGAMFFGLWSKEENLNSDTAIHACLAHNLGHNYLDGYRYYAYDLPVWLTEGFGHWWQRAIDVECVNYCNIEGTNPLKQTGAGWPADTRRLVMRDRAAPVAELTRKNSFAELDQNDHLVVWSKVDFLIGTDHKKFAAFVDRLKGRTDTQGFTLSRGLPEAQREAMKEIYGWSYPEFEEAWKAHVLATYATQ